MKPNNLLLVLILILGLFLSAYGIKWGLPTKGYYFSYNSDEVKYVKGLSAMDPLKLDFNPDFYDWGIWHYYELGAVVGPASLFGLVKLTKDKFFYYAHPEEMAKIYLFGRFVSILLLLATIYVTYLLGKKIFGVKAGLLASLFLAVNPGIVINAHYLKADISVTFWISLLLLSALFIFETGMTKWYVISGIFTAISAGAQYNGFCFGLSIFFAHFLRLFNEKKRLTVILTDKKLYLAYLVALLVYLAINLPLFSTAKDLFFAIRDMFMQEGAGIDMVGRRADNLFIDTFRSYSLVYTPLFVLLAVAAIFQAFIRRKKKELLVLFWFLPYLTLISVFGYLMTRYQILISSGIFVLTAGAVQSFYEQAKCKCIKAMLIAVIFFACLYAAIYSFAYDKELARPETVQQEASRWIMRNISSGSFIGICGNPEIRHYPQIIHQSYFYKENRTYNIVNLNGSIDALNAMRPEYLVMDKKAEGYNNQPQIEDSFSQGIRRYYKVIRIFERYPSFYGLSFRSNFLIADWETPFPVIAVLKRK